MTLSRRWILRLGALLALLPLAPLQAADTAAARPLLVYAAASLTNALQELGTAYQQSGGQPVQFSFAASSTLARQIEAGAVADLFFSADTEWMDYLQTRSLIASATRTNLLGNRLVLVAPADSKSELKIASGFALAAALGTRRLAMGDPDSVPAGKYGRAALQSLGVWDSVADQVVRGDSVRTALAFVDRGEAPFGIVYETDALIDRNVRLVDRFPESSHPAIVYPVALTSGAAPGASAFLAFLKSAAAQAVFRKYGFTSLVAP
ncbi:MAG: molybdate ABC transporter substrate-binding protein [Steroidobacteraceae bacterium]